MSLTYYHVWVCLVNLESKWCCSTFLMIKSLNGPFKISIFWTQNDFLTIVMPHHGFIHVTSFLSSVGEAQRSKQPNIVDTWYYDWVCCFFCRSVHYHFLFSLWYFDNVLINWLAWKRTYVASTELLKQILSEKILINLIAWHLIDLESNCIGYW